MKSRTSTNTTSTREKKKKTVKPGDERHQGSGRRGGGGGGHVCERGRDRAAPAGEETEIGGFYGGPGAATGDEGGDTSLMMRERESN